MAKNDSFSDTELANMDTLIRRLQAVDKSAQSMNIKLQRIIDQNEVAVAPTPRKSLENPAVSKPQPKESQTATPAKPVEPVNVGTDEDLFFTEPLIEPVPREKEDENKPVSVLAEPLTEKVEPVVSVPQEKDLQNIPSKEQTILPPVVNNIENTNIIAAAPPSTSVNDVVSELPASEEPVDLESPVQKPQIIEKAIPIVNTVEKITEPPVESISNVMPEVRENNVPVPVVKTETQQPEQTPPPTLPSTLNIVSEPPEQPAVNVTVEPSPISEPVINMPEVEPVPSNVAALTPVPEVVENKILEPPPPVNIPVSTEKPTEPQVDIFAGEAAIKEEDELPPVLSEPEAFKPEESLNLADQNLVEINKNINNLTQISKQGHVKLAASVDSLNKTVSEILRLLPTLQAKGGQQNQGPSRNGREERIDAANLISSYRQGLGISTRSYTQNTIFPGGNSIA